MDGCSEENIGISVQGEKINNLRFADDIDLIEEDEERLSGSVNKLNEDAERVGLKINIEKTKTMVFGKEALENKLKWRKVSLKM